eukprot:2949949-Prymnesium_polylepis.2
MERQRSEDMYDIDQYIEHVESVLERMMVLCSAVAVSEVELGAAVCAFGACATAGARAQDVGIPTVLFRVLALHC